MGWRVGRRQQRRSDQRLIGGIPVWCETTQSMMEFCSILDYMATDGVEVPERVAIIVGDQWFEMSNEAADPVGAFEVSDAVVREVLEYAHSTGLVAMHSEARIGLWHSHTVTQTPSEHDIEHFPRWCAYGLVYHIPTRTTLQYGPSHIAIKPGMSNHFATGAS